MTDEQKSEAKSEVKVGDMLQGRRVVAVAEAGYYTAPMSSYSGQPLFSAAKFVRVK